MKLKHTLSVLLFCSIAFTIKAQETTADSAVAISIFEASLSIHEPGGDLKENFGQSTNINVAFNRKLKTNWTFGGQVSFITGGNVKNETELVSNIISSSGALASDGRTTQISMDERGMNFSLNIGKVYPIFGSNKNSGLWLQFGAGYLYHKIKIEDIDAKSPIFLDEEILKGYDNLSAGPSTSQSIGYIHLSDKKVVNFYVGLEFIQAYTKNLRKYSYQEMKPVSGSKFDSLIGIKIGWVIPTYKRVTDKYHFY